MFEKRVGKIEVWHPVFSDDIYKEPLPENPVWSDDYPEPDDQDDDDEQDDDD